jgi:MoxR-like ATPase
VLTVEQYITLHEFTKKVKVSTEIRKYIIDIVNATREDINIKLGASPRGSLALTRMAQASAVLDGRNYAIPDDVKNVAVEVLSHRVIPLHRRGLLANNVIIQDIVDKIIVP